ncbi:MULTISPECIES: FAD-dependent monooxygenase [unclassified Acinetobacter]|uniref:FAD-dependent monooxygenase n=1 Tax=unclassified Acinetobacter TaxID=196816 RepID=UPI0035B787CC
MTAINPKQEILIVGGGMVGLSLALMLAKQNIATTLIESVQYPALDAINAPYHSSFDARNTALSRRSVQIYQDLGLWQHLQKHATPIHQVHISEMGGFGKARLVREEEQVESFGQVLENAWLGRVLLKEVLNQPLINLIDGAKVTALSQDNHSVQISYEKNQQSHHLTASLLIACDGRDSFCRQALGVGVDVVDYQQVAMITAVQTSKPHQHIGYERFSPLGPLALLPLSDGEQQNSRRRSVVWIAKKGEEHLWLGEENDAKFLTALQDTYGHRAGKFEKTAKRHCYDLQQVLAHKQAVGRVVLMGNAAHTLHPVAGQGFNLCLRDAVVLVRYLQHQVQHEQDVGNAEMLKQYEQERLDDQKRVILFCDQVVKNFSHQRPISKLLRNMSLLAFDAIPKVKPMVANFAMGLKV